MAFDDKAKLEKIRRKFIERLASSFLDIVILAHFQNKDFTAYEVMQHVRQQLGVMLSPGRIYSTVYSMERKKLLEGSAERRKRLYKVTELGKITLKVTTSNEEVQAFMSKILKEQ